MKHQQIFDKVAISLLEQGKEAWDKGCQYVTEDGRRCAVGWLLTNQKQLKFAATIVGGINNLVENAEREKVKLPACMTDPRYRFLLEDLQNAHDGPADCKEWKTLWKNDMLRIADKYKLDISVFKKKRKKEEVGCT
jgi:hypothetical protein